MSINSLKCDRPSRQPIILLRKRKAESDIEISSQSDMSSPERSEGSVLLSSCESSPYEETDSGDEQESADYPLIPSTFSEFRGLAGRMKPFSLTCRRKSPLPEVSWAEQTDLWQSLVIKDTIYRKDPKILLNHPEIEPNMRTIVLDWLTEVCQVYKLHRETYYLAQDYIDRFLMLKSNLPKSCLQLLGVTALFVAAKMEEIYPPRLDQYSFVTDNACSDSDILAQE
ncbi:G1/S-specific cyclin-E1, partial [Stegodyphus mimosarum]